MKKSTTYKQKYSKTGKKLLDGTGDSYIGLDPNGGNPDSGTQAQGLAPVQGGSAFTGNYGLQNQNQQYNVTQPTQYTNGQVDNNETPYFNYYRKPQNNQTSKYTNASIAGTAALGAYYGASKNGANTGDKSNVMRQGIGSTVSTFNPVVGGIISGASAIGNNVRTGLEETDSNGNLVNREGARRGAIAGHFLSPSTLVSTIGDGNWDITGNDYLNSIEKQAKANLPKAPDARIHGDPMQFAKMGNGGGIHIKPENVGKFTEYKERTGKTTEEALHSPNAHVRQMANFALQSSKWNKKDMGGYIEGSTHDLGEQEIKDLIKQGYKIEYV